MGQRPAAALERVGHGAAIHCRKKSARRNEDTAQTPRQRNRVHSRSFGRSGRQRKGSSRMRDAEDDLLDLLEWGRKRGARFAVRLVKGAYWDFEKIKSRQNGWTCPVFLQKPESDLNFEVLTRILLENESTVTAAFGSHNVRSIAHAQALADQLGIDRSRFEFQLLYGMAGPVKRALVEMGYRVREYCPVGELLPGMSYLVRRLLENTSNEGFLRAKFSENVSAAELLRDPKELVRQNRAQLPETTIPAITEDRHHENDASIESPPGNIYQNSPLVNFVYQESQEKMRTALREMRNRFGEKYPLRSEE